MVGAGKERVTGRESWKSYKEDLNIGEKPLEP
jgi:hypothetical protein